MAVPDRAMSSRRAVPTLLLGALFVVVLVAWGHQQSAETVLGEHL